MSIMKKMFVLLGMAVTLMSFRLQGGTDAIVTAFKSADAAQIGAYFDEYVDIKLLEKDEVKNIGRNQATIMLKAFLTENSIKGFEKTSERAIGNTMYLAGKLLNSGKGYSATVMLKAKDGKWQIISLRIS